MTAPAYTLIGHVCVDEVAGGTRLGGTVHFAAGQAVALGCEVRVITSATTDLARRLWDAHDGTITVELQQSATDTRFGFSTEADGGPARLLSGADPLDAAAVALHVAGATRGTVHLGPIANEIDELLIGLVRRGADYLGITPQGLLRSFNPDGTFGFDTSGWPDAVKLADAIVVNEAEYLALEGLDLLDGYEGLVFRTRGPEGATVSRCGIVLSEHRSHLTGDVDPARTIGAGDVFAAAAFVAHSEGESPEDALEVAVEVASHWVHRDTDDPVFVGIDV